MKRHLLLPLFLLGNLLHSTLGAPPPAKELIERINCGSAEVYVDESEKSWSADRGFSETSQAAEREKTLPIHATDAPVVYRTERYGIKKYILPVAPGTYAIRLHFAETFDSNYQAGVRSFGATINGKSVLNNFDPFTAAGGFARPAIIEYTGCSATNAIQIDFTGNAMICGIELFRVADKTPETVRQISPTAKPGEDFIGQRIAADPDAKQLKILFIGNSMVFFWAIPESLQAMLEVGTPDLRIEPHRSLHGGKNLKYHYTQTDALEKIATGNFDFVVLQEYSKQMNEPDEFAEYAKKFEEAITASGAKTLLYAFPGQEYATDLDRRNFMALTTEVAREIDARIIPVCETLRLCHAERPDVVWHNADTIHMGMFGGYAVACTFYTFFTDGADFPPPAILAQQVAIDPALALFIQKKAREAVAKFGE